MPRLNEEVKIFIVTQLAQFRGYAEVARLASAEAGVVIDRFQVRSYDPTNMAYAGSNKWRAIFEIARHDYLNSVDAVPISSKAYRLNQLQCILNEALSRGDVVNAMAALRQAAKEVGTLVRIDRNARTNNSTNSLGDLTSKERRAMATEVLRNALDNHAQKVGSSIN